jgi:uncharacterized protein (DUF2252 family)
MMINPFAFLRGAGAVMTNDLAQQPAAGAPVQACGDCHLMNFDAFNTPENNILFVAAPAALLLWTACAVDISAPLKSRFELKS